mgnify:FL=1|jgi:rubrerythrin
MANSFSALEMLKIAMLMEDEGYKFYKNGAKNTSGKLKEFLLSAEKQEFIHKEKFSKLHKELEAKNEDAAEYLYDDEVSGYLKSLIENQVYKKEEEYKNAFVDLKTAVKNAYDTEVRTVEIYTKLYDGINDEEAKKIMAVIIGEEKDHVAYFEKLMNEI